MKNSIWSETTVMPSFPSLSQDIKTDVAIIGGGMAGILCAYMLEKAGVDYALVERAAICSGVTQNTTAKITSQHGLIYEKIAGKFGLEKARLYLNANQRAIEDYREICKGIDCQFTEKDSFVYSIDDRRKIEEEVKVLETIGFDGDFVEKVPLPFPIAGAVRFRKQAQFNPLAFVKSICAGLNIYENTKATEFDGKVLKTTGGDIRANKVIVATHFPFINKHGSYFMKMYQQRSYVIAYENLPNVGGMYIDEMEDGMSFRNYENMLLIGGGGHRTGKQGGNWSELEEFATLMYPGAKEKCRWSTQDCMTLDGIPYIGKYSKGSDNLYVATGFNKWGMTTSMVGARILTDLVLERENEGASLFNPSRTMFRPQLAVNAFESITGLLTLSKPRCPHLGCGLKYNKDEHSFDCPCHGSRFSEEGHVIDNPATGDLNQ